MCDISDMLYVQHCVSKNAPTLKWHSWKL